MWSKFRSVLTTDHEHLSTAAPKRGPKLSVGVRWSGARFRLVRRAMSKAREESQKGRFQL